MYSMLLYTNQAIPLRGDGVAEMYSELGVGWCSYDASTMERFCLFAAIQYGFLKVFLLSMDL